ncbi:MAG: hypothetical protein AAF789_05980 [Bacteroidota bacterium]
MSDAVFDSLYQLPDSIHQDWPISKVQQQMVSHLIETTTLPSEKIIDTLHLDQYSSGRQFVIKKMIRLGRESMGSLNVYILRQVPLIVFFALPVFAFFLKLFFWRKGLYIEHLIHSIHLHSMFFLLMSFGWIINFLVADIDDLVIRVSTLLTAIYVVISFRKVYGEKI